MDMFQYLERVDHDCIASANWNGIEWYRCGGLRHGSTAAVQRTLAYIMPPGAHHWIVLEPSNQLASAGKYLGVASPEFKLLRQPDCNLGRKCLFNMANLLRIA